MSARCCCRSQLAKARIDEIIKSSPEPVETDRMLLRVPGAGMIVPAILIAELPAIGTTDRRKISALAGLAPIVRDGGQ